MFLNFVPGITSTNSARYSGNLAAVSAPHLIAQYAAEYCTGNHTDTTRLRSLLNRLY